MRIQGPPPTERIDMSNLTNHEELLAALAAIEAQLNRIAFALEARQ